MELFAFYEYLLLIVFLIGATVFYRRLEPYKRGFRVNDVTLNKPITWPLEVAGLHVIYMTLPVPLIVLNCFEFIYDNKFDSIAFKFAFGWSVLFLAIAFIKQATGRPRPFFLMANQYDFNPDDETFYYGDNLPPVNDQIKVVVPNALKLLKFNFKAESRLSFFSAHSTYGAYTAMYIIIYLHERIVEKNLLIAIVQFGILCLGLFPGITQARCYWHHWDDVIVGHTIGGVAAYVIYNYVFV